MMADEETRVTDREQGDLETAGDPPDGLDHTGGAAGISQAPDPGYEEYTRRHGRAGRDEPTDTADATAGDVGDPNVKGDVGSSADVGHSGGIGATGQKRGAHKPR